VYSPSHEGAETDDGVGYPIISQTNFDELKDVVLPKMKTLYIAGQICTGEQVERLARIMPNLVDLRIGLGNDGFQMVCKVWNKLEEVNINPFQVDEQGLLGMKTGGKYHHFPNITDLKRKPGFFYF